MATKRDGVTSTPAEGQAPAGNAEQSPSNNTTSSPESGEQIGFTGLPIEEQRRNFIKIGIFLVGAALLVFGLKQYFGW